MLENLVKVRINGIKHNILSRMEMLKESIDSAEKSLAGVLSSSGELGRIDVYATKFIETELLVEIGRLMAYTEIYRELIEIRASES